MSKGPTKAQLILKDAQQHIDIAQTTVDQIRRELSEAEMALLIRQNVYLDLHKALAVTPRKVAAKKASKKVASKSPRSVSLGAAVKGGLRQREPTRGGFTDAEYKPPICGTCGNVEDFEDHSKPSPRYHPFQPPAPTATRPSSPKTEVDGSTVSSETDSVAATDAAHAASGGD
jgi:hypothetical protein